MTIVTELQEAYAAKNLAKFTSILNACTDQALKARAANEFYSTGIAFLCTNYFHYIKLLLEAGLDVNAETRYHFTPLHYAQDAESVHLLLDAGADATAVGRNGYTTVHAARDAESVRLLLKAGADVTAADKYGYTPLHHTQDIESVRLLLDAGADPKAVSDVGRTPLHYTKDAESVRLLLEAGADPKAKSANETTPLHLARDAESVRLLLEAGADPKAINNFQKYTPLHCPKDGEAVRLLLEAGADPKAKDGYRNTPLHEAQDGEAVRLLLEAGADPKVVDTSNRTPLHNARDAESVRVLLEAGADPKAKDVLGIYPMYWVHKKNDIEALKLLKLAMFVKEIEESLTLADAASAGAGTATSTSKEIQEAFVQTLEFEMPYMCAILLEAGADINTRSSSSKNALDIAVERNNPDAVEKMLSNLPDDVAAKYINNDSHGGSLLQATIMFNSFDCIKPLLAHGGDLFEAPFGAKQNTLLSIAKIHGCVSELQQAINELTLADLSITSMAEDFNTKYNAFIKDLKEAALAEEEEGNHFADNAACAGGEASASAVDFGTGAGAPAGGFSAEGDALEVTGDTGTHTIGTSDLE